jgi:phage gp29-like protein
MTKISRKLIESNVDRVRKTIDHWIAAIKRADDKQYPSTKALIDLYDYVALDTYLTALIGNRMNRVIGEHFVIRDASGRVDEDKTKLLKRSWFTNYVTEVLKAKFWGYSLIELGELNESGEISEIVSVNRRHVLPNQRKFLIRDSDIVNNGINLDTADLKKDYVLVHQKDEFGLLQKAAPLVIFKRFALADHSKFAEVYGQPFKIAKTNLSENKDLTELITSLQQMGSEGFAIIDSNDDIEFHTSSQNSYEVYVKMVELVDKQLHMLVCGNSDGEANYSQARNHKSVMDEISEVDIEAVEFNVNSELIPRLIEKGYPFDSSDEFAIEIIKKEAPLVERAQLYQVLLQFYDIPEEQIKEEFNVTVNKKTPSDTANFQQP